MGNGFLVAVGEALHFQHRPLCSNDDCVGGSQGLGMAELLADLLRSQGVTDTPTVPPQILGKGQGLGTPRLVGEDKVHLYGRVRGQCG